MKRYILSTLVAAAALCSCQDDWNDHYDQQADGQYGSVSIYEIIASRPELSDFRAVLDSARLFASNRMSSTHYSELLARDQFLTVWAPVNGTFDRDSLLRMCQTSHGDSLVELHFLKNHIARYGQSAVGEEHGILTLNRKTVGHSATMFGDARIREANIASRNGVLHILDTPSTYRYNIYEALYSLPEFNHVGRFLQSYQIDEFDETQSLAMGVVDGKVVYVDSVFYSWNKLLQDYTYGHLDREDSTYWMLVPDRDLWDDLYADAERYFRYPQGTLKADSIHDYWSNYALLQDLVYNPHAQISLRDSLCSTTWRKAASGDQYHVYHNPWAEGGLMSYAYDSLDCSNGSIYRLHEWPFSKNHTYHKKIVVQAEGRIYKFFEAEGKTLTVDRIYTQADSVSGGGYVALTPTTNSSSYYVQYEVPGVLSGTYDVCAVILPKTVRYADEKEGGKDMFKTNKFVAEVSYVGADGKTYSLDQKGRYKIDAENPSGYTQVDNKDTSVPFLFNCDFNATNQSLRAFTNDPYCVDTIHMATVKFPACNYDQQKVTTIVTVKNSLTNKQAKDYNSSIYLDCILFLPREDE